MSDLELPLGDGAAARPAVGNRPLERRRFLKWVSAVGATVIAALAGVPVLRAFLSPALAPESAGTWVKVADDVASIETGVPVRVSFVQRKVDAWLEDHQLNSVWLYTADGQKVKAYNPHCTHLGCAFAYDADTKNFACPCHRGQFDVKTGHVLAGPPPRPLDELTAEIRSGAVWVNYRDFRPGTSSQVEA